jgi:hypothetical protein
MTDLLADRLPAPVAERSAAWPPEVRLELGRRRVRIEDEMAAAGVDPDAVLDLSRPGALELVLAAGDPASPGGAPDAAYGAVLSVGALVAVADLPRALRGVGRLLTPTGRFRFVEPVGRPGWGGIVAASAGSRLRPLRGQHLGRDLPLAVRANGFVVTDLERITMPTPLWPLRWFVDACARPRAGMVPGGAS